MGYPFAHWWVFTFTEIKSEPVDLKLFSWCFQFRSDKKRSQSYRIDCIRSLQKYLSKELFFYLTRLITRLRYVTRYPRNKRILSPVIKALPLLFSNGSLARSYYFWFRVSLVFFCCVFSVNRTIWVEFLFFIISYLIMAIFI